MKRLVILAVMAVIIMSGMAFAEEELPWLGSQWQAWVIGTAPLTEGKNVNILLQGQVMALSIPSDDYVGLWGWIGPVFEVGEFWFSPQIGLMADGEDDAQLGCLFAGGAHFDEELTWLIKVDEGLGLSREHHFVFVTVDENVGPVNIGLHEEFADGLHYWGPHVGITNGPWHFEVQWFVNPMSEKAKGQFVRTMALFLF